MFRTGSSGLVASNRKKNPPPREWISTVIFPAAAVRTVTDDMRLDASGLGLENDGGGGPPELDLETDANDGYGSEPLRHVGSGDDRVVGFRSPHDKDK